MITYDAKVRVNYKDTDQMGIVHHSNYIVYYEMARVEALSEWGMPYSDMEKSGIISPILEVGSKYIYPAHFDEVLTVRVIVEEMPMVRLKVSYELYNEDNKLINTGHTWLGFLNAETKRPRRAPQSLIEGLKRVGLTE